MNRRQTMIFPLFRSGTYVPLAAALLSATPALSADDGSASLNIVLITADDLGTEIGCYGYPNAGTPRLDAFASQGVRYENAYVTQSSCSPSRAAIFTGLYPHQNGMLGLSQAGFVLDGDVPSLPQMMNDAGYRTVLMGKHHLYGAGFDVDGKPFQEKLMPHHATRGVNNMKEALDKFFASQANDSRPFFLSMNFVDPHRPFLNQCQGLPEVVSTAADTAVLPHFGIDNEKLRQESASYRNCIKRLDSLVGLLLDRLEKEGYAKNTLVIFVSDNGAEVTRSKITCYEAGVHVPLMIRCPGRLPAGAVDPGLTSSLDIMPTILDAAGLQIPARLEGVSLLKGVASAPEERRTFLFTEYSAHMEDHWYPRRAVRNSRYKLIQNLEFTRRNPLPSVGDDAVAYGLACTNPVIRATYQRLSVPPEFELHDLSCDPYERVNLADNPEYADVLNLLKGKLMEWRQRTEDVPYRPEVFHPVPAANLLGN